MPSEDIQPELPDSTPNSGLAAESSTALTPLVSWAEGLFKTDIRYLVRGLSWSTLAQIFASGSAFILSLFMSRLVPKEVYGEYKYILAIISILSTFSLNNIGEAVFQSTARGFDGAFAEGFKENIKWSAAVFLGAFAFGAYYLLLGNMTLGVCILIGGCATPFLGSANLYNSYLLGKKDFPLQAWYGDVVTNFIPMVALVITIFISPTPIALIIVYFASNLLAALYAYMRVLKRFRPDRTKRDPGMLTYGKHLSFIGVIGGIANNLDQILLFHFAGAATLAIYNFSIGILDQTKGPLKTLDSMIQARFVTRDSGSIDDGMRSKIISIFIVSAVFVICYIIAAPYLYDIFFPTYHAAIFYSQIYAISLLVLAWTPATSYLSAKKRVVEQYISIILNSLFQIAVMLIGIMYAGLLGLIIARVVIRFVGTWFNYGLYKYSISHTPTK